MKTLKKINKYLVMGILIMCIMAIILIVIGYSISEEVEYKEYNFNFQYSPSNILFNDFQIEYDFNEDRGKISFEMTNSDQIKFLYFILPLDIDVTKINWYSQNKVYKETQDYIREENTTFYEQILKTVKIENLNNQKKEYISKFEFLFNGKLSPNTHITLRTDGTLEGGAFFKFKGGNKYECSQECFTTSQESTKKGETNDPLLITTKKKEQGWENVGYHDFYLNYNKKNKVVKEILPNIGFGFFFIGFSLFLIPLVKFIENLKVKRKNKKEIKRD